MARLILKDDMKKTHVMTRWIGLCSKYTSLLASIVNTIERVFMTSQLWQCDLKRGKKNQNLTLYS